VGVEIDGSSLGAWDVDELKPRTPGRDTSVAVEARRGTKLGAAVIPEDVCGSTGAPASPRPGFEEFRVRGLQALLRRLGPDHPSRKEIIAAAATNAARSFASCATQEREPMLSSAMPSGHALWNAAERHAVTLYRRAVASGAVDPHDPAIESVLLQHGTGQPLPAVLRHEMERALGVSLAGVRIHTDGVAAQAARALGAEAFTLGEDIFFADGTFAPDTRSGRTLLAHELTHVTQALRGRTGPAGDGLRVSQPDDPLEREAEAVAERIGQAAAAPPVSWAATGSGIGPQSAWNRDRRTGRVAPADVLSGEPDGVVFGPEPPVARSMIFRDTAKDAKSKPAPKPAPPPPGPVLYIGMNNYQGELLKLTTRYPKKGQVTAITPSATETATDIGTGKTFDLTASADIDAFSKSFGLKAAEQQALADLIKSQTASDRDDLAHVVKVYADVQTTGAVLMVRVVLSGHSGGMGVFGSLGEIYFAALVKLKDIFPLAAAQVQHVMVAGCNTGDEATMNDSYVKAFPNVRTIWAWAGTCPTGPGAAAAVEKWAKLTEGDVHSLPKQGGGIATWSEGKYEGLAKTPPADALAAVRADDALFKSYFDGTKVDPSSSAGPLYEYYLRVFRVARRPDITGPDHDEMETKAQQALRLRFYAKIAKNFATDPANRARIKKGYGSAPVPSYETLSRADALKRIAEFAAVANGDAAAQSDAKTLLETGLRDLSPALIPERYVE
jgi:hypothetical protein